MPAEKNIALRIIVPVLIVIAAIAIVVAGYRSSARQAAPSSPTPPATPAPAAEQTPPASRGAESTQTRDSLTAPTIGAASPDASPPPVLRARPRPKPVTAPAPIGALSAGGPDRAQISFTLLGAGVESITMAEYFETITRREHYQVQQRRQVTLTGGAMESLASLAARAVLVDGQLVDLFGSEASPVWEELGPGRFEAIVEDATGADVLRLRRVYSLRAHSFLFDVEQSIENLSGGEVRVEWVQYGPIELHAEPGGYGLDMRRVRIGHLLDQRRDPSRQIVQADTLLQGRAAVIDRALASRDGQVWPRPADFGSVGELCWVAQTSRYFAFAVIPKLHAASVQAHLGPQAQPIDKRLSLADEVYAVVRGPHSSAEATLLLQLTGAPVALAAGGRADLSFAAYAGPLGKRQLSADADALFGVLGLEDLVIYNVGGPCAWCTFQPLARGLLAFLTLLHDHVVFDYAIAIMILVVCVRAVLHPVTRRSQIGLARFSKQMQSLAPKQQKIREKYKDDPKKMQAEMILLMKEERVNYSGALGCLPMFLQTPIWIALYAMLYFSFDLRHESAFYGVFQAATGGRWTFLADLSVADHFIDFGRTLFTIPLIGIPISGLNVLPIILGVVFFIQQKYLTPPPTTAMSPEQEMQMKMMKVMTVVLFPVLMYPAPAGLSLYFITNSTLGILESRWIRAHINELDKNPRPARESPWLKRVENMAKQRKSK
jgi:YidC/Oxa1 family membrane protein insertase